MSWRTVIIADRAKIDYAMGYMAVRGRDVRKVFMDEIGTVVIESTAVSLTAAWVSECLRRKIKIIFCDGKHDPAGEVIPYYGSGDTSRKVREQAKWTAERKAEAWQCVIREKIRQQAAVLREFGFDEDAGQLDEYREGVQPGDRDNREGQAAKVYFHALCGRGFSRRDADVRNAALNYGYAVLLAACNREIASAGYLTQFGLFHDNTYNPFNLGSDLMEPFRPGGLSRFQDRRKAADCEPDESGSPNRREAGSSHAGCGHLLPPGSGRHGKRGYGRTAGALV